MRVGTIVQLFPQARHERAIRAESDVRSLLPVVRRIGFASVAGGTGCTTVATRVAEAIAVRRVGGVLLVDAANAEHRRLGRVSPAVDRVVVPSPVWPGGIGAWRAVSEDLHRRHELTVTDWGRLALPELMTVAEHSHLVCVTTTTELRAFQAAIDAAALLRESGTRALVVASAVRTRAGVAVRRMVASATPSAHLLPHDKNARRATDGRVSAASEYQVMSLAAAIVRASTTSNETVSAA